MAWGWSTGPGPPRAGTVFSMHPRVIQPGWPLQPGHGLAPCHGHMLCPVLVWSESRAALGARWWSSAGHIQPSGCVFDTLGLYSVNRRSLELSNSRSGHHCLILYIIKSIQKHLLWMVEINKSYPWTFAVLKTNVAFDLLKCPRGWSEK